MNVGMIGMLGNMTLPQAQSLAGRPLNAVALVVALTRHGFTYEQACEHEQFRHHISNWELIREDEQYIRGLLMADE